VHPIGEKLRQRVIGSLSRNRDRRLSAEEEASREKIIFRGLRVVGSLVKRLGTGGCHNGTGDERT